MLRLPVDLGERDGLIESDDSSLKEGMVDGVEIAELIVGEEAGDVEPDLVGYADHHGR